MSAQDNITGRTALPSLLAMDQVADVLQAHKDQGAAKILIKITVNPATEVVRLSEPDPLRAEAALLHHLEQLIRTEFADGHMYQVAFNAYLIILDGDYQRHIQRLRDFVDAHAPCRVDLNQRAYYPKIIAGITPLEKDLGCSLSRLEFAARKAAVSAGRTANFVAADDLEFAQYKFRRAGLRTLRQALNQTELGLFAQPIVAIDRLPLDNLEEVRKYEILLRHYEDAHTISSPLNVLSFAAFNNVTQDLDLYVMDLLCKHFHRLFGADGERVDTVTVNIFGPSFIRPRFAETVIAVAERYGVPAQKLVLEITEDVANSSKNQAIETMNTFRAAGFKLALDDIGTGSSNFRTLHEFPVDYFKIDRSYCEALRDDASIRTFVQLIIDIGKANQKLTIAEGIPDLATKLLLSSMGADFSQSFLTGRPEQLIAAPLHDPADLPRHGLGSGP